MIRKNVNGLNSLDTNIIKIHIAVTTYLVTNETPMPQENMPIKLEYTKMFNRTKWNSCIDVNSCVYGVNSQFNSNL